VRPPNFANFFDVMVTELVFDLDMKKIYKGNIEQRFDGLGVKIVKPNSQRANEF
jgi:hypothetical protein